MTSRREFIRTTATAGAGLSLLSSIDSIATSKNTKLRMGFIGVGFRGQGHLARALERNDIDVIGLDKYDHPLWKKFAEDAAGAGHGGMDWFVFNAFVEAAKQRVQTPQDVYDAVTWCAISPLSEASIAQGGAPVEFPDFTNGKWMYRKNEFALSDTY